MRTVKMPKKRDGDILPETGGGGKLYFDILVPETFRKKVQWRDTVRRGCERLHFYTGKFAEMSTLAVLLFSHGAR